LKKVLKKITFHWGEIWPLEIQKLLTIYFPKTILENVDDYSFLECRGYLHINPQPHDIYSKRVLKMFFLYSPSLKSPKE
jgi:hypothetical protein